uniref:ABC transporter substrate binding protein n=2 Tax=Candidatus Berkiella cookevillensis TaxID=437022 RepID=A0A0Q9YHQ2_9GAMM
MISVKAVLRCKLFLFIFSFHTIVLASSSNVLLISSNSHFAMVHRIEAALFSQPSPRPNISHILVDELQNPERFHTHSEVSLIVCFGAEALEAVLKLNTEKPVLAILIRKNTFYNLLSIYHRKINDSQYPISAIYLDQSLQRQINLIQTIFPDIDYKSSVGVLFGPGSINQQEELLQLAAENQLRLNTIYVNNFENPVAVMDAFLDEVRVLLALPDNRIFNPHSARGILLAAFHKHVPLIGYSQSYVKNGALISLFSSTKQIAQQTAQAILTILDQNQLPVPQYPNEFSIEVNYQVARSLNINIDSETDLHHKLLVKEKANSQVLIKQGTQRA